MKKIVMLIIIFILVAIVFVLGINVVKPKISSKTSVFYAEETTFYATIKEINEYEGTITLLVEGLETNKDVNKRGRFTFSINDTKILLNENKVDKSYLKKGMLIAIGDYAYVQETYPARLVKVKDITIIE
ncbi:MAG: hypothetical protein IKL68_04975 [Clostridia bacterium]|nr:hypothetical protein [Clostridia bacterium]